MNRKEALKTIAALGISAVLPFGLGSFTVKSKRQQEKNYIIAFGDGACRLISNYSFNNSDVIAVNSNYYGNANIFIKTPNYRNTLKYSEFSNKISIPEELKEILLKKDNFLLLSGLGGATGSFLIKKSAEFLKHHNKNFRIVCSLPFKFEGNKRNILAQNTLFFLNNYGNVKYLDLEKLRLQTGNTTIKEAFENADKSLSRIVNKIL